MKNRCSNCQKLLDRHTPIDKSHSVSPGSVSICFNCGQVCIFQEDLTLRNITEGEMAEIAIENSKAYMEINVAVKCIKERSAMN